MRIQTSNANLPRITVVTPSFNQADFLEQTLLSVLDQGYPNLEYIVIDGGSTDRSTDIIRQHAHRLAYWVSEKDGGQSEAINKGFALATGDVYCWINSDDYLEQDALTTVGRYFNDNPSWQAINGGCRLVCSTAGNISSETETIRQLACSAHAAVYDWNKSWFAQQSTFWRRQLWQKVGPLRCDLHYTMDLELWRRFTDVATIHPVPDVLATYRFHHSAKCISNRKAVALETFALLMERENQGDSAFCRAARQQIMTLAEQLDSSQLSLHELSDSLSEARCALATQAAEIESLKNSRWLKVGRRISGLIGRNSQNIEAVVK